MATTVRRFRYTIPGIAKRCCQQIAGGTSTFRLGELCRVPLPCAILSWRGILVTGGAKIQIPNIDLRRTVYYAILKGDKY